MKLKSILIIIGSLFISCEDTKEKFGELTFDMRLPQDNNGFYLLNMDRNNWQTLHRVTGKIETNGQGVENFWVSWQAQPEKRATEAFTGRLGALLLHGTLRTLQMSSK